MEGDQQVVRCGTCGCELALGRNVLRLQEGVIGPRGFIELEDPPVFCGYDCLRRKVGVVRFPDGLWRQP